MKIKGKIDVGKEYERIKLHKNAQNKVSWYRRGTG